MKIRLYIVFDISNEPPTGITHVVHILVFIFVTLYSMFDAFKEPSTDIINSYDVFSLIFWYLTLVTGTTNSHGVYSIFWHINLVVYK
jgi:hypothetical protein